MTYSPAREVATGGGLTLEEFRQSICYDIRRAVFLAGFSRFEAYDEELEVIIRYVLDRTEYCRAAFTITPVPQKGTTV
jgi:hypothetical protein